SVARFRSRRLDGPDSIDSMVLTGSSDFPAEDVQMRAPADRGPVRCFFVLFLSVALSTTDGGAAALDAREAACADAAAPRPPLSTTSHGGRGVVSCGRRAFGRISTA